jgi:hypothetical protein
LEKITAEMHLNLRRRHSTIPPAAWSGLIALSACVAPNSATSPENAVPLVGHRIYTAYNGPGKTFNDFHNDSQYCDSVSHSQQEFGQCMLNHGNPVIDDIDNFYFPYSQLPPSEYTPLLPAPPPP